MFKTCRTTSPVVQTTSSWLVLSLSLLVFCRQLGQVGVDALIHSGNDHHLNKQQHHVVHHDHAFNPHQGPLHLDESSPKVSLQEAQKSAPLDPQGAPPNIVNNKNNNSRHSLGTKNEANQSPSTTDLFYPSEVGGRPSAGVDDGGGGGNHIQVPSIDGGRWKQQQQQQQPQSRQTKTTSLEDAHRIGQGSLVRADHVAGPQKNLKTTTTSGIRTGQVLAHLKPNKQTGSSSNNRLILTSTNFIKQQHADLIISSASDLARPKRHAAISQDANNPDCELQVSSKPAIYGLRCDDAETSPDGAIIIRAHEPTRLYLIGRNLYSNLTIALTAQDGASQDDCTHVDRIKSLKLFNLSNNVAEVVIEMSSPDHQVPYYLCVREDVENSRWFHQGSDPWLKIYVKKEFVPSWLKMIIIAILLCFSGLFSGLNLGLMSLDKNELQVIMKCGTRHEKKYAATIEPVRRRGNYLLCSILFSNTLVNSTISVFLEDLSTGLIAIISSTVLIVLFGEILPQAFCSRHGLAVGAKTIWLTNACMFITAPLSYLVSYCLDWALGEEIGHAYDRDRLMEFIRVTKDLNNLETDEVNIIAGALKIKSVKINEVMTRIEDVYMIDMNSKLDFDTMHEIVCRGYSRIPVHEPANRRNIEAVLFTKDLALVDPKDETPVRTIINFNNHPRMFVYEDTTLDKVLNEFRTGRSHLAIVQTVVDDGERDPYMEVTGIVTLEDVIEEIIQMEINDETDTVSDNRRKRRRKDAQVRMDFSQFAKLGTGDSSFNVVSPQLNLAAYQYLATTVDPFTPKYLSDSILRRLLSQRIYYKVKMDDDEASRRLYTAGEPADYFIMILEGRVHVVCGKENLVFDGGPFSFFGRAALVQLPGMDNRLDGSLNATLAALPAPTAAGNSANQTPVQLASSTSARRDSCRPMLSRRESLAKIVASSLNVKKASNAEQLAGDGAANNNLQLQSPGSGSTTDMLELADRSSQYFKPDYTVEIIANCSYLKVTRSDYLTALKATKVERDNAARGGPPEGVDGNTNDSQDLFKTIPDASPTPSIEGSPTLPGNAC